MVEKTCGSLAFYQWLLYIYHRLMVTQNNYMLHIFKCVYAISRIAMFWQSNNSCHDLWSDSRMCACVVSSTLRLL
jgi:hypothetical protein